MGVSGTKYSKNGLADLFEENLTRQEGQYVGRIRNKIVPTHTNGIQENTKPQLFTEEAVREYQLKFDLGKRMSLESKMAEDALKRQFGVPEREATARIVLCLRPMIEISDDETDEYVAELPSRERDRERPWTTIDYCFNRANGKESLDVRGKGGLDSLLPDDAKGLIGQGLFNNETTVNVFFNFLDYFINNLEGRIWWNGFTMKLCGDPRNRLQLIDLEMDPLRLIFKVKSLREIDIIRSAKRFELVGKPLRMGEEPKTLRIWGWNVSMIRTMAPKDGTILLNFPLYNNTPKNGKK